MPEIDPVTKEEITGTTIPEKTGEESNRESGPRNACNDYLGCV